MIQGLHCLGTHSLTLITLKSHYVDNMWTNYKHHWNLKTNKQTYLGSCSKIWGNISTTATYKCRNTTDRTRPSWGASVPILGSRRRHHHNGLKSPSITEKYAGNHLLYTRSCNNFGSKGNTPILQEETGHTHEETGVPRGSKLVTGRTHQTFGLPMMVQPYTNPEAWDNPFPQREMSGDTPRDNHGPFLKNRDI